MSPIGETRFETVTLGWGTVTRSATCPRVGVGMDALGRRLASEAMGETSGGRHE